VLAEAGLRAAVLDARSLNLAQAASASLADGTLGLLAVGKSWTTLLVLHGGRPRFWRILRQGPEGWAGADRPRLLRAVADSLAFCRESEGIGPAGRVLLAGLGARTGEVASALTEWLGLPVSALDLSAALRARGHPDDLVHWGAAIGAAIRPC
jgi:Tfp pilus assembly PilM family ATPase